MKISTLTERIEKAEAKIIRKQGTIEKKTAAVAKKTAELEKIQDKDERYWIECDIKWLNEDLKRLESEIKETEKTLEKYRAQMAGEIERERVLIREIPETLIRMRDELVTEWDGYDKTRRDRLAKDYDELGYSEFVKKHGWRRVEERLATDEQIHEANVRDAEDTIINLLYRVRDEVGTITDWSDLHLSGGVLNGYITGTEGKVNVETIGAGGYNIQRYHLRVLVKKIR